MYVCHCLTFTKKNCKKYTANMCSEITVEMHLKNCNFEKLQFFTVDQCSLYFLQLKNCNFNIFTVFKNTTKKNVKIKKMAKIHSSVLYKFNLTTYSHQA